MKKIVVVYATAGIGHKKAAVAVKKALDEIAPKDTEVALIDSLDYTNAFFKWTYLQLYLFAINKVSTIWGFMYALTDNFFVNLIVARLRRISNWLNSKRLRDYLITHQPDAIISTHFFASEVIGDMKTSGKLRSRLITVITDYRLHSWWLADGTDTYIVSNDVAKNDLIKWRVDPEIVKVIGIPVEPSFAKKLDANEIRNRLGVKKDMLTILVIGGGFGVGPIEGIVKTIDSIGKAAQVIVVCGHNKQLVKTMMDLKVSDKLSMNVLGFVDNVYEYMEVSDLLISKAGGITVSESLAKNLPMIIISPIPGQESRNSEFLTSHGAARQVNGLDELKVALSDMLKKPEEIEKMRYAIGKIRAPMACYDIAKAALE